MVTHCFKRRTASRQAVSRKVEGIEPRKWRDGKDDAVIDVGSQYEHNRQWQGYVHFLGVRDHGMFDNVITRQPGRPRALFPQGEYAVGEGR